METFIKVYIKSEEDLPEKEGNYISCTNDTNYIRDRHYRFSLRWNWLNGIIWYLKPVEIPEITDERFKMPTDKQLVEIALLFNDGKLQKSKLRDMIAMCEFVLDRLYENNDVTKPSSKE